MNGRDAERSGCLADKSRENVMKITVVANTKDDVFLGIS